MPADSNGKEAMQSLLATAFSAAIAQNAVVADDEHVGDELFVIAVQFGFASVEISRIGRGGHDRQVFFHVQAEALEYTQLFKKFAFKTKHSFFCSHIVVILRWNGGRHE